MDVKEIRQQLMEGRNTEFRVKGFDGLYDGFKMACQNDVGVNAAVIKLANQMNVKKFGPTCMTLYTFDMFDNRITGKIKYEDVTLITTHDKIIDDEDVELIEYKIATVTSTD